MNKIYVKIDKNKYINSVTNEKTEDCIELDEKTHDLILNSKFGHCTIKLSDKGFYIDKKIELELEKLNTIENILKINNIQKQKNTKGVIELEGNPHEMGFAGNVWIRKLHFPTKDHLYEGHSHSHDHLSLLITGKVLIEVEGFEPTIFTAPTYIVIKAEHEHKITALEDDTLWWCIHAMRDQDGEVVDVYGEENSPYRNKL